MYTLLKPLLVRENLLKNKLRLFTAEDFSRLFLLPKEKVKYFLEQQVRVGLFCRLKKGLYMLKTDPVSEEEIANRLYQPSYISFEYALAYYNLLPEMPYRVTSATTKPTRSFSIDNKTFEYLTIKPAVFTGYRMQNDNNQQIFIAEPEKAMVDYLYFVSLGKKTLNDRLDWSKLNKKKILKYSRLFNRPGLEELCLIKK